MSISPITLRLKQLPNGDTAVVTATLCSTEPTNSVFHVYTTCRTGHTSLVHSSGTCDAESALKHYDEYLDAQY